jgi:hypothetical protein
MTGLCLMRYRKGMRFAGKKDFQPRLTRLVGSLEPHSLLLVHKMAHTKARLFDLHASEDGGRQY